VSGRDEKQTCTIHDAVEARSRESSHRLAVASYLSDLLFPEIDVVKYLDNENRNCGQQDQKNESKT
jgi:hypothetical protein